MASHNVVHSNAFNFQSFFQNNVDPRTGQYTLGIVLPALIGNDLAGPQLPLRLFFSPLNDEDSGFGKGWTLALSQYLPGTHMLTLHSGETFKVTGSGAQPGIREKKLDTFHFHDDTLEGKDCYRIAHKSGLVEVLTKQAGTYPVYLPTEVYSPSGHKVELGYGPSTGYLESISYRDSDDQTQHLLKLTYTTSAVTIEVHPNADPGELPRARYSLELFNRELRKITLPTSDLANWRIDYDTVLGLSCVTKLHTPSGAVEQITYGDNGDPGHVLPTNGERVAIPRVTTHVVNPGAGQPPVKTTYTYLYKDPQSEQTFDRNFVGYNSGISWSNDGQDNLFRAQPSYKYGSTAHVWGLDDEGEEVELRTVERVYNRFHLMEAETTRQAGHVQSMLVEYHGDVGDSIDNQLGNFQMPKRSTQSWALPAEPGKLRSEVTETVYNTLGNLIKEVMPNGQQVVSEFYPAQGEDGCPPDPELFERSLKHTTVVPAPQGDQPAPTLRSGYRYRALGTVGGVADTWLLQEQITLREVVGDAEQAPLQVTSIEPVDAMTDLLRHGRPLKQTVNMNGHLTTQTFDYQKELVEGEPALVTVQTIKGFDHDRDDDDTQLPRNTLKVITLKDSILIGAPLLNRDDADIEIAYTYDALNRTTSETVSPNDPEYMASRLYEYYLVGMDGQQAWQTSIDVKGVNTRSLIDGLNRVVLEQRHDADAEDSLKQQTFRVRYEARYDALGQLLEETDHDWFEGEQFPLRTRYLYDNWGQRCCEIGPDEVQHHTQNDPIGTAESGNLPIQTSWSESKDGTLTQGKTVAYLNLFEQPDVVQRFDRENRVLSKHQYFYDGLGRTVREIDARNAVISNTYDAFDRLVDHTLADRSVVHRDYAPHSSADLPVKIAVNGAVLGEQTFDGLDRMTASITGGRKRVMFYEKGQSKPWKVRTPANREVEYDYTLQLTDQPEVRRVLPLPGQTQEAAVVENYTYDRKNARLTYCGEPGQELTRDYFSTGELKLETRTVGNESWSMTYGASLQGRALTYQDVLGQTQHYKYDTAGRLEKTWLGGLSTTFSYDELGNLKSYKTCDGVEGEDEAACVQWLLTELEYDDLGREKLRRFTFPDSVQELTQEYSALDQLTLRVLSEGGEILREENYDYDLRGRLEGYTCTGPLAPQDPCGKTIREQQFAFDRIDNITWVYTAFDGDEGKQESNEATYLFGNEADPAQLTGIENTHADYPAPVTLSYDPDGNMISDEQGRRLDYDPLGRLASVELLDGTVAGYGYDALDRLASQDS